ncbi:MAG: Brp/Blh family beta-carotene 15,15'-dioxygenase, partial [Croceitalea sp.]|nr:Brp/Blh family beta-carotene 15,15'-dioxygenase [Croceitalea sp.]
MKSWIVVATFFCLWLSTSFPEVLQSFMAYGLILTFGVLHGANDINLIVKSKSTNTNNQSIKRVLLYYILTVVTILVIFFLYPQLALLLFIVLSGYHFGEQHFENKLSEADKFEKLLYLSYGLTILFMIFLINFNEVNEIINEISNMAFSIEIYRTGLIVFGGLFILNLTYLWYTKKLKVKIYEELFYLLVFYVIFNTASLIWGFCIYFILWHSIPSLYDQMNYLYGETNKSTFLNYLRSSWLYWLISVVGLGILLLVFGENHQFFISILLYFLAAITFPHVI